MGQQMKLRAAVRKVLRGRSADPRAALMKKAQSAKAARDWHGAAAFYAQALELREAFGTRVQMGHMLKEAGDLEGAEAQYFKALALQPDDADLHMQIGHFYFVKEQHEDSVRFYRKAVDLAPNDPNLKEALRTGERRAADAPFKTSIEAAMKAMSVGRWREAEEGFRVVQAAGRDDYLHLLGHAVKEQGRLDEAVDLYQGYSDAVASEGGLIAYEAELQLARTLQFAGRFSEAAVHFAIARDMRMQREGWVGSVDDMLDEIRNCVKRVHPSLDPAFIR